MEYMCDTCMFAKLDYEEYYGGGKEYFVCGCRAGGDIDEAYDCPLYEVREDSYD